MITRSNLADQLRKYQVGSKHDWATASFFSSTSSSAAHSSRLGDRVHASSTHEYVNPPRTHAISSKLREPGKSTQRV